MNEQDPPRIWTRGVLFTRRECGTLRSDELREASITR